MAKHELADIVEFLLLLNWGHNYDGKWRVMKGIIFQKLPLKFIYKPLYTYLGGDRYNDETVKNNGIYCIKTTANYKNMLPVKTKLHNKICEIIKYP